MFSSQPPQKIPASAPAALRGYLRRTNEQLESLSRFQGLGVQGGTMPTEVPGIPQFITGRIRNEDAEGSGSGSTSDNGEFSIEPDGAGFTDEEGYLAFAFDQTYDVHPWKGEIVPSGIKTVLPTSTSGGSNYAYPLNGELWEEGANVLLKRAGRHWIIIGGSGGSGEAAGSGSDGNCIPFSVDCGDGETTNYLICSDGNGGYTATATE